MRPVHRACLLCVCLALALGPVAQAETLDLAWAGVQPNMLDLAKAYRAAQQHDATFRAAMAARDAGREEQVIGRSQLLPTVSASYTTNWNRTRSKQNQITDNLDTTATDTSTSSSSTSVSRGSLSSLTSTQTAHSQTDTSASSSVDSTTNETEIEINRYRNSAASLQLRQPLINFGATAAYRQGTALTSASEARFRAQQQELMVRVAEAYAGALFAEESRRLALSQLETLKEQQVTNERMLDSGEGTITDVLETRAKRELAQAQLIEAEDTLVAARNRLNAMTGLPSSPLAPLKTDIGTASELADTPEAWRDLALTNNGQLQSLRHQVEAANQEVKKAQSGHYPRLDLVASIGRDNYNSTYNPINNNTDISSTTDSSSSSSTNSTGTSSTLGTQTSSTSNTTSSSSSSSNTDYNAQQGLTTRRHTSSRIVGLELNIPLFSGGSVSARTRQTAARLIQSQAEMDAKTDEILLELNRQFRLQQSTSLRVKALSQAVESSRVTVDATIKSTAAGVRTNLDVLNARERLTTAERDLANARYSHLLAYLRLRFQAGVLAEEDLMKVAGRAVP